MRAAMTLALRRPPPGPGRLRALAGFAVDPLRSFLDWSARYGPVVGFELPIGPACLVWRPEELRRILVEEPEKYGAGRLFSTMSPLLGSGLAGLFGAAHMRERRLLQPMFDQDHLVGYASGIVEITAEAARRWPTRGAVDLHAAFGALTLDIASKVLLGASVDGAETVAAFREVNRHVTALLRSPLHLASHSSLGASSLVRALADWESSGYRAAIRDLDRIVNGAIRKRREVPSDSSNDMLSRLLGARYSDGSVMDDGAIRDEIVTFLFAGYDTTSALLSFAVHLLSTHPEVLSGVLDEHRRALEGRLPELGDLVRLERTRMVVDETLRLYPPGWMTVRRPNEDVILGGHRIARGTEVFLSEWVLHRQEAVYPDAGRFDVTRWKDRRTSERLEREGKYAPFLMGRKKCIGYHFAKMEASLVLATVLQLVSVAPRSRELSVVPGATLHPRDLMVTITRRVD